MSFLEARDIISGQEAKAFITIEGRVEELFYAKKLEAKVEKNKAEIKTLGRRVVQHKPNGWKGTGSMTVYYTTTLFRQMMLDYIKTGQDMYFDMQVTNEDPGARVGKQTILLKGCNLNSVVMTKFEVDAESLEEDLEFTFTDVDILDSFQEVK